MIKVANKIMKFSLIAAWKEPQQRHKSYFAIMAVMVLLVGIFNSWNVALSIVCLSIISAVMTLGLNMQWGYAGLLNVGVMGFAALGGVTAMLTASPPVAEAWRAGGWQIILGSIIFVGTILLAIFCYKKTSAGMKRIGLMGVVILIGVFTARYFFTSGKGLVEMVNPIQTGFLGGLNLPILIGWPLGGLVAGAVAILIGKIALGLRSDYLAIATLGISEIIVHIFKNEEWLTRGVKNVTGLPRPVPYEVDLRTSAWFKAVHDVIGGNIYILSSNFIKICYIGLFLSVLIVLFILCERALASPWGRMMRAIRDNETAAAAMGKDVVKRHLQIFVMGSAIIGIAGAMLVTFDGQFTPSSYHPLRYTFLIWAMVVVGGSGNNYGSILGGFLIWFYWVQAEPIGLWLINVTTFFLADGSGVRQHLLDNAVYMRYFTMGLLILLVMRFNSAGLLPEPNQQKNNEEQAVKAT